MFEYIDADGVVLTREEYRAGLGKGRVRQVLTGFEPSIVDESKLAETDLNVLVRRWMAGAPQPEFVPGQFGDVSEMTSFQEVQDTLIEVRSAFMQLPPDVRERFANDPVRFADAVVDPSRREELVQLGLFAPPAESPEAAAGAPEGAPAAPKGEEPGDKGA